jgi:hypothetical protein
MNYEESLELYKNVIDSCPRFEFKGKSMPYTSANGYMFSLVNKAGEIGFRYSKKRQQEYFDRFNTSHFISYGAKMQGYILLTKEMLKNHQIMVDLLNESYDYVMSLPPK